MENNNTPANEALLAQEAESHKQIEDYIATLDLETASNELRIDLIEFVEAAQALMGPGDLSFDSEDCRSESSRSSASSVKFLIAAPLKDIPEAWKSAFTTTPNDSRENSFVSTTPSINFSKLSKDIISSNFKKTDVPSPKASAIMFIRSPAESSTSSSASADASEQSLIKHFKQIGGTKEATLSPYYEARDGSKKAVLVLRTNHATPPSPSPNTGKVTQEVSSSEEEQGNDASMNVEIVPLKKFQKDEDGKETAAKAADTTLSSTDISTSEEHSSPSSAAEPSVPPAAVLPPKSSFPKAAVNLFPAVATCANATSKTTVLKITNIPWTLTNVQLIRWFGSALEKSMLPPEIQVMSVHICCDRFKGRTRVPAFLEVLSSKTALKVINEKSGKLLDKREIKISIASKRELMTAIFPTWAASAFSTKERTPILSDNEIAGLKELCKLKAPFVRQTPERPFMNILSIAAKFPWKSKDTLSSQGDEQNKALQLIRDGYKLLNQYGKRIEDYDSIRSLFHQFLETHGGITGSLRSVSVSPAICATSGPLAPSAHTTNANTSSSLVEDNSSFSLSNSSSFASFSSPYKRALLSNPFTKREVVIEMDLPDKAPAAPPSSHVSSSGGASPKSSSLLSGTLSTNTRSGSQDSGSNTSINGDMLLKILQKCSEENKQLVSSENKNTNKQNPAHTADTTPAPKEPKQGDNKHESTFSHLKVRRPEMAITPARSESVRGITQLNAEYEKQDMLARKQAKQKERESRQLREAVKAAAYQRQAASHHYHPYQRPQHQLQQQQQQTNTEVLLSNPYFRDPLLSANSSYHKQLPALPVIVEAREEPYTPNYLSSTPNDRFAHAAQRALGVSSSSNTANTSANTSFSPRVIEKPSAPESLFTPDAPYKHTNYPLYPPGLSLPQYATSPAHTHANTQSGYPYGFMTQQQHHASQMQMQSGSGGKLDNLASEFGMNKDQLRMLMQRLVSIVE